MSGAQSVDSEGSSSMFEELTVPDREDAEGQKLLLSQKYAQYCAASVVGELEPKDILNAREI